MPPFFDDAQIHRAVRNEATPALERLAANPELRDRILDRRFERDDPPPYASSTEEDEDSYDDAPPPPQYDEATLSQPRAIVERPLTLPEQEDVADWLEMDHRYSAGTRFTAEVRAEHSRLLDFIFRQDKIANRNGRASAGDFFRGRAGEQRRSIIVRRNIRRRWQKLGVWNPAWGIPGRVNKQPNDREIDWKWAWQHGRHAAKWTPFPRGPIHANDDTRHISEANANHPTLRAVQLRENLARGAPNPPPPRSKLGEDASAALAESFITSRPWFAFYLENTEEHVRLGRLVTKERLFPTTAESRLVGRLALSTKTLWKQRGDWKDEWIIDGDDENPMPGWKWRHESPSPEPEDLTALEDLEMDFTRSEIDALEAIPPPTPPPLREPLPPKKYNDGLWRWDSEQVSNYTRPPPPSPKVPRFRLEESHRPLASTGVLPPPPPPPQRRRQRRRQNADKASPLEAGPVRRSLRIAARKARGT